MKRISINLSIALAASALLMLLAGVLSWGYYSSNSVHYVVLLVAMPLVLAAKFDLSETARLGFAFLVYFSVSLAFVSWARREKNKHR